MCECVQINAAAFPLSRQSVQPFKGQVPIFCKMCKHRKHFMLRSPPLQGSKVSAPRLELKFKDYSAAEERDVAQQGLAMCRQLLRV